MKITLIKTLEVTPLSSTVNKHDFCAIEMLKGNECSEEFNNKKSKTQLSVRSKINLKSNLRT